MKDTCAFGVWLRLVLTIPVIVAVMLSGFLLRADAAAQQALPVLRTLLGLVPFAGAAMQRLLTGAGADLSTIYLHHACTATVIIWLVTVEHTRRIMPTAQSLAWIAPPVLLLSFLLVPGLEWRTSAVEKGPWYLVGLQEFLHWLPALNSLSGLGAAILVLLILLPVIPIPLRLACSIRAQHPWCFLCCVHPDRADSARRWLAMEELPAGFWPAKPTFFRTGPTSRLPQSCVRNQRPHD